MRQNPTPQNNAQTLAFSSSSASVQFSSSARLVVIIASAACWVKFGTTAPTAVKSAANNIYVPANFPLYFGVEPSTYIAAIQDSAGGNLCIAESQAFS